MNKYIKIGAGLAVGILLYFVVFNNSTEEVDDNMVIKVQKGNLPIEVIATGELKAKNSQKIFAPAMLRSLGIRQIKISDMAPEGTILKKGDFVASLDPSEIGSKLNGLFIELDQKLSDLKTSKLDTTLSMRAERETILNLKYNLEENELEVKQSIFEPPAVKRKAEISLEKAKRNHKQAISNLRLKKQQAASKVFKVQSELKQLRAKITKMETGLKSMEVTAPQNGMLIYYENWEGKIKAGSSINIWNPTIASIPDLSEMISKTFVNEIDISKIKKGQKVTITIDAFADKIIEGEIISIANIGQRKRGSDAKVFKVEIKVEGNDSILRPAMTTTNKIRIKELKNILFLPIECIFNEEEKQFVYTKNGKKVTIKAGESSSEFIEITEGVEDGMEVLMIEPGDL